MDSLRRDLRLGARVLIRERGFCALAVLILALGICGVTTMFGVVNGTMLRGFSFPNADRLVSVRLIDPSKTTGFGFDRQASAMDYEEIAREQRSFELMAAFITGSTVNVTVNGSPQRYTGAYITEHFLRILGVGPAVGRDFRAEDNRPGAEKVALISHALWQRDFGATPDIVGKAVRINGKPATIIGVMPEGFTFPTNEEMWLPLFSEFPVRRRGDPQAIDPDMVGLIGADVSLDQASAEMMGFATRFAQAYPETNKRYDTALVQPLIVAFTPRQLRGTLFTMLAFCVGVLLIACVNVMNMQFSRATLRARELGIRSSLGASRMRLVRQMLTESLLLAGLGAVGGVALAWVAVDMLQATVRNLDNPPPAWVQFDIDYRVLLFTVVATLAATIVSGLLPAWLSSRAGPADVLREGGRSHTSRSVSVITRGLVVLQIVVTCILLVGSLLQVRSIVNQQALDYGYDIEGILSARMGLMDGDYPSDDVRLAFHDRLLRHLRAHPEFEAVALTNRFRMIFSGSAVIEVEGLPYRDHRDRPRANFEQVTADFHEVLGQRILDGRALTDDDSDQRQPVAVVNEAFARKHFGNDSAVGRRFRTVQDTDQFGPWRTIVGTVSTVRMLGPFNDTEVDESGFYVPFYAGVFGPTAAGPIVGQFATLVVKPRAGQPAYLLANVLRREVNEVDPNLPLYYVGPPKLHIDGQLGQTRIVATLFSIFGGVAVVLAAVGIYGVMSFWVSRRTQEFGVRMALGADHGRILAMVLRQGSVQLALGLVLGIGLAVPVTVVGGQSIRRMLVGVDPRDPTTYLGVAILVTVVSLVATLVPARRATRVDPMIALRTE